MKKKFIGKLMQNEEWVTAENLLSDSQTDSHYILYEVFEKGINLNSRRSLAKYKVYPDSIGESVNETDAYGNEMFTGDHVNISYRDLGGYVRNVEGIIRYSEEYKVPFIRASNGEVFLFKGDVKHSIRALYRLGRAYDTLKKE